MKRRALAVSLALVAAGLLWTGATGVIGTGAPAEPAAIGAGASRGMPFALERIAEGYEGTAREVLEARGYTYVAVAVAAHDVRWTVGLSKPVAVGARVRVRSFGVQRDFESRGLARVFSELRFGVITVVDPGGAPARPTQRKST